MANPLEPVRAWAIAEWIARFTAAVEMMTEVRPECKAALSVPAENGFGLLPDGEASRWHSIPFSLSPVSALVVGAAADTSLYVGQFALAAAGIAEAEPAECHSTYMEMVAQAASGLAQAIATRLGQSVSAQAALRFAPEAAEPGPSMPVDLTQIDIVLGDGVARPILVGLSIGLEELLIEPEAPAKSEAASESADAPTGNAVARPAAASAQRSKTLDLLMEVELPVSVSFGRAQIPLKDVLKLNSGSIVELNRTINEPVEIIVNNCVIARGEVVVIDGNYGVRIRQVISREERLRTLR